MRFHLTRALFRSTSQRSRSKVEVLHLETKVRNSKLPLTLGFTLMVRVFVDNWFAELIGVFVPPSVKVAKGNFGKLFP